MRGNYILYNPRLLIIPVVTFVLFVVTRNVNWILISMITLLSGVCFCRGACFNPEPGTLQSPASGEILDIKTIMVDQKERTTIMIYLSLLDVHVQYCPLDCTVKSMLYRKGVFDFVFENDKGLNNEKLTTTLMYGDEEIVICQVAGKIAKTIVSFVHENDTLKRGDPMGQILLGSRVTIQFNTRPLNVKKGDIISVGSVLCTL